MTDLSTAALFATLSLWALAPQASAGSAAPWGATHPDGGDLEAILPLGSELVRLVREIRLADGRSEELLVEPLAALALEDPSDLFRLLESRTVPPYEEDDAFQRMSIFQEALILSAFRQLPADLVRETIAARLEERPDKSRRSTAVRVLGSVGVAQDIDGLLSLAKTPFDPEPDARMEEALRSAIAEILGRDAEAFAWLDENWRRLPDGLLRPVIQAVGDAGDPLALEFLAQIVVWRPELDDLAMSQVRRVGASLSVEVNFEVARHLRPFLDPDDRRRCQNAALALAELGDVWSIPTLIELLEHEERGTSSNALWALREVTGMQYSPKPDVWVRWRDNEIKWFDLEARKHFERLRSHDEARVARAIRLLSGHPLFRHEIAREVEEVLFHPRESLRLLAVRSLGDLGSPVVIAGLVQVLNDRSENVRDAAWDALRDLTGKDLPLDAELWFLEVVERYGLN